MAKPTIEVIQALRETARDIQKSDSYQWGHMGLCNCGFLAQNITRLSKEQIHTRAMERHGDWTEQLNDYCPTSGMAMDHLISEMLQFGFDSLDLKNLEQLSSPEILATFPSEERYLQHNVKSDVVKYLYRWAALLENTLAGEIELSNLESRDVIRTSQGEFV
jgi:hypothetical protein